MAARSFAELIRLLRVAEDALRRAGQTDASVRITTLRGIYYGADWSLDARVERNSSIRKWGFFAFTGGADPVDPRPALGSRLFDELAASQTVSDQGRRLDIGHALIGLDARDSVVARSVSLPTQGGTGLEIVTWLGDLGGGAGNLAYQRVREPRTNVGTVFVNRNSDYGTSDNLEGDVAGYLVAAGDEGGGAPRFGASEGVADVFSRYLALGERGEWSTRATRFAKALGANVTRNGLENQPALMKRMADQILTFGASYVSTRFVLPGRLKGAGVNLACQYLRGAAQEVVSVFVRCLADAIQNSSKPLAASGGFPKPSAKSSCESTVLQAAAIEPVKALKQQSQDLLRSLQNLFGG